MKWIVYALLLLGSTVGVALASSESDAKLTLFQLRIINHTGGDIYLALDKNTIFSAEKINFLDEAPIVAHQRGTMTIVNRADRCLYELYFVVRVRDETRFYGSSSIDICQVVEVVVGGAIDIQEPAWKPVEGNSFLTHSDKSV
jgi:hypothetical protein